MPYLAHYDLKTRVMGIINPFGNPLVEEHCAPDKRIDREALKMIKRKGFLPAQERWGRSHVIFTSRREMVIIPSAQGTDSTSSGGWLGREVSKAEERLSKVPAHARPTRIGKKRG